MKLKDTVITTGHTSELIRLRKETWWRLIDSNIGVINTRGKYLETSFYNDRDIIFDEPKQIIILNL